MSSTEDAIRIQEVRDRTREVIRDAVSADSPVLVEAPPNSGKTVSAYESARFAEQPITYLASRIDLYEEAEAWAEDQPDVRAEVIPSPQRDCPTFKGKNDGDEIKAKQLYNKGVSGAKIHYHGNVDTPCHYDDSSDDSCKYMERRQTIQTGLENGEIDLLAGNHQHAYNSKYIENRIVIFDEFDPSPFVEQFPSDEEVVVSDYPGDVVSGFLDAVEQADEAFPSEIFQDVTDILTHRTDHGSLEAALEWFETRGVTRGDVMNYDFYDVSTYKYDPSHRLAPLLTLALLCMRKVGKGVESAPPPSEYDTPRIREAWRNSGLHDRVRCVRNRNTGHIFVLRPPDLTPAWQVIGLDGLPSKRLWDLIFAPRGEFDHRQIISRENFSQYLSSALNMTVKQIGDGRYPYTGGRISDYDEHRLAAIKAMEGRRFALISTKKALEKYAEKEEEKEEEDWLQSYVKTAPELGEVDGLNDFAVMNYASVKSSNDFQKEDLGVVSGSPLPAYSIMRRWVGLCGEEITFPDDDESLSFEGAAADVHQYFDQHQVVQAILRFGRHEDVWDQGGSTVYVNTLALPDWFAVSESLSVEDDTNRARVIEFLIEAKRTDEKKPYAEQNLASLDNNLDSDIDKGQLHKITHELERADLVTTSDRGNGTLYEWAGDEFLFTIDDMSDYSHIVKCNEKLVFIDL